MADANGVLAPHMASAPSVSSISIDGTDHKRKREEEDSEGYAAQGYEMKQTQSDILQVLERHDTEPSFLRHAIERDSTSERSPKKVRLSDPSYRGASIADRLSSASYADLDTLQKDAEHVSEELVSAIRQRAKEREREKSSRSLVEDLKQVQKVQAFEKLVKEVVEQEEVYQAAHGVSKVKLKREDSDGINGHAKDVRSAAPVAPSAVLTLFGNAPTPKQLFSSMQHPATGQPDPFIKPELPVEEMSLPTGLTATKIESLPTDGPKKSVTFDTAFPPASNLPALNPPKSHKRSSTRDTTITWEFKDPTARNNKKGGYTIQSLTAGDWLSYGNADAKEEPSSPREKRKQRDRALSGGESSQEQPLESSLEDALAREEEALFKQAYSSFAPSCDNSKALIPEETKSMVWWQKVGQKRYDETFALDPALFESPPTAYPGLVTRSAMYTNNDDDFERVLAELDELEKEAAMSKPARDKTDVEQVLREVSELLETLASHQRIRNASLPSSTAVSRTPISPAPALASRIGRPDSPADDEMSTYYSLRRELAYLLLRLPPYAVAKLDGDQLAELGVRQLITFEGKDTKGTMEDDQIARQAKYNAINAAAGAGSLSRSGSSSNQHYNTTSQRTPAIGQAANTRYGQSSQYGPARTPITQTQYQRPAGTQSYGTPSATAPRPGYGQQPNYGRLGGPQSSYAQPNGQQYYQRPLQQSTSGYGGYQQNQATSQTQQRMNYSTPQYQQRSQAAAQNAVAYQSNTSQQQQAPSMHSPFNRMMTNSPIKPAGYNQPVQPPPTTTSTQPAQSQQQPGSGRATPASYPSQPQTPVNGLPHQRPVAPRAASGTPQPPADARAPPPLQPAQANGHA